MSRDSTSAALRIFGDILDLSPEERARELRLRCAGNADLRARVEGLLRRADQDDGDDAEVDEARAQVFRTIEAEARDGFWRDAPPPERIGDYTVSRRIGHGGMGVVYEAEQAHPKRRVAIKVLQATASLKSLARFRNEVAVLARLQHPGVAQIFEAGSADLGHGPQPYFAMEFVEGETILEHARHLDPRAQLALIAKVCDAVAHAHDKGVIHRDLKPGNILVTPDGQPKVLDFGIASTIDDADQEQQHTRAGQLVGTIDYMSPEQASGRREDVGMPSDVYSLGVIMFEMLTRGRRPHDTSGQSIQDALRTIAEHPAPSITKHAPAVRGDAATIVGTALATTRERRYQGARDLGQDIRAFLDQRPIAARSATATYRVKLLVRRHRAWFGAGVFGVVCLVVAWLWTDAESRRANKARSRELLQQQLARGVASVLENDGEVLPLHIDQNWSAAPYAREQHGSHDAFAMPFVMPEDGHVLSVEFAMANTGCENKHVQVAILHPTGKRGSGNFGTNMLGSPVEVFRTGEPTFQSVESKFGLQPLGAGPHCLSLTFSPSHSDDPDAAWFMPGVEPSKGMSLCWVHTHGQKGWQPSYRAVRFRVNYRNGAAYAIGHGCGGPGGVAPELGVSQPYVSEHSISFRSPVLVRSMFVLFLGFREIPAGFDLAGIGAPGCRLFVEPVFAVPGITDAHGRWGCVYRLGASVDIYAQAAILGQDSRSMLLTNAGRLFTGTPGN